MLTLLAQTTTTTTDPSGMGAGMAAFFAAYSIVVLVFVVFYLLMAFLVVKKAGYNPWLSLLIIVPFVNFIMLIIFAFSEWPVVKEVKALRAQLGGGYGAPAGYAAPAGGYAPPPPGGPITPA
jgi:hypothetical protein